MKNEYSFSEKLSSLYALVLTRLFYRRARLIRRPFYIRGRKRFVYSEGFTTGHHCRFDLLGSDDDLTPTLFIGKNCKMGDNVHIVATREVRIGDGCLFASKIFIGDTEHGNYSGGDNESSPDVPPDERKLFAKPIRIGNRVWIGENVCVLSGSTIGDGSIIGANSVVTGSIPAGCIAIGIPARVVKRYHPETGKWEKAGGTEKNVG